MNVTLFPESDVAVDLRDLHCPHLLFRAIAAMEKLPPGKRLRISETDISAPSNLSAWARQAGHAIVDMYEEGGVFMIILQRGVSPP